MPGSKSLSSLPSVDELTRTAIGREISSTTGERHTIALARLVIAQMRSTASDADEARENRLSSASDLLTVAWGKERSQRLRRVINATGVVIHTNLGRAPLSGAAVEALATEAARYCTLEYDSESGKRGRRGRSIEELIVELTGAEDSVVVNNCAAAAFLVLTAFASGGEVLISRGEMVEIGGDFRVPDVLAASGAKLREVGTTNRTKIADYERSMTADSRMILRVHPSNYRIVGFTARPEVTELAALAKKHKVILYEDIGSGALDDLGEFGLVDEPVISRSIKGGASIVTFSGDKLLGGPQAGIIAGKKKLIDVLRKHPLYRALRVDKLVYAALQETLESHRRGTTVSDIPVIRMLSLGKDDVESRVDTVIKKVGKKLRKATGLTLRKLPGRSAVGGGSAPAVELDTVLIAVSHSDRNALAIDRALRSSTPAVIARSIGKEVVLDLRTVFEDEIDEVVEAIAGLDR
jgi:L-seryl-tRNA(Ser) seleniumtransferase